MAGLGGPAQRDGTRRTVRLLAVCEHHALTLARLATSRPSSTLDDALGGLLAGAVSAEAASVQSLRRQGTGTASDLAADEESAGDALGALEAAVAARPTDEATSRWAQAVATNTRTLDEALGRVSHELREAERAPSDDDQTGSVVMARS